VAELRRLIPSTGGAILDSRTSAYTEALVGRVRQELGDDVIGIYLFGSAALQDYRPPRSDLDVAVVAAGPLTDERKERLADRLAHRRFPCPARKLELVVYEQRRLAAGDVSFELDLNTGPGLHEWRTDPATAPAHWFVLDVAIARDRAPALAGPPAAEVFPEQDRGRILHALRESLHWHLDHAEAEPADKVLNACRAWHFTAEGTWASKTDAGRWATAQMDDPTVVKQALDHREGLGTGPVQETASEFAGFVRGLADRAAGGETGGAAP
jgi:predicted nucleotidyltransferase